MNISFDPESPAYVQRELASLNSQTARQLEKLIVFKTLASDYPMIKLTN